MKHQKWLKALLVFTAFVLTTAIQAKPLKIAIIDTGITRYVYDRVKICTGESRDFTGEGLRDSIGHGSHIASIIAENLKDVDYCLIIIKFFSNKNTGLDEMRKSLEYANSIDIDYLNISAGGYSSDLIEKYNILSLLNKGVKIVAAAGNDKKDLSVKCSFYPACYDSRVVVVGNKLGNSSNYDTQGDVIDYWEDGERCIQITPTRNVCMSGTSQAAAITTNRFIKERK